MKKKTKKKILPFQTKAPKGKVAVHVLVEVDSKGQIHTYAPTENETMESALAELGDARGYNEDLVEHYHLTAAVDLPKAPKIVKPRAKKVTRAKPAAATEAVAPTSNGAGAPMRHA